MASSGDTFKLALAHHQAGRLAQADQLYRQVLAQQPDHADAMHLLGTLALQAGRREEAVTLLQRVVAAHPRVAVFRANLGSALLIVGRYEEAIQQLTQATRLAPEQADAFYNLGVVYYNLNRWDESQAAYRRALNLRPNDAATHNNLGDLLRELGELDAGSAHLEKALAADPNSGSARYNRSLIWLSRGRLPDGWDEYEWRWRCPAFQRRNIAAPEWNGAPSANETLLIHAEQGLGDTIQFIRYLPLVRERCPRALVEIQPALMPLFSLAGIPGLIPQRASLPPIDRQLPMLSLPRIFRTTLDTIPGGVPYLTARADLVESWRQRLAGSSFKVGIAWQGRTSYREDAHRSIALGQFAPLAALEGVELISLQKGPGSEQISALAGAFRVVDFSKDLDEGSGAFMDTAAVMKTLDLVITSDTSIAHLAGALGVPVWVALRLSPDWRWLTERDDCPWYPTMRLFRQQRLGDWPGVFGAMAQELARMIRGSA